MATSLDKIYDVFYSSINEDLIKHPELDVTVEGNIVSVFLDIAIGEYGENLQQELTISTDKSSLTEDIAQSHINILGKLVYKKYLERELNSSLRIANNFNKRSELQVTGMQSKIIALRECLTRISTELNRSFTRNILKRVGKGQ